MNPGMFVYQALAAAYKVLNNDFHALPKSAGKDARAKQIIRQTAWICAGWAVQPVPVADFLVLTPLQGCMAWRLANLRGVDLKEKNGQEMVKGALATVAMGYGAQQGTLALYKAGVPLLGGVMTIPIVFSSTYAIGCVMDAYLVAKAGGRPFEPEDARKIYEEGEKEAGDYYNKNHGKGARR